MVSKRPTKAIIAAAGFGTRFLPQTKAMPKEMLPIVDKPVIQYLVEDLVKAGIRDIIIVGSSTKRAIEDHFDEPSADLVANLQAGGTKKKPFLDNVFEIANMANFVYLRQKGPYGNATPLACARHLIDDDEPFVYLFADDIVVSTPNTFTQLIDKFMQHKGSVLNSIRVTTDKEYESYGIFGGKEVEPGVLHIASIIEKPGRAAAPSDYAHVSSFVFEPTILEYIDHGLEHLKEGQEFYVSDSLIAPMIADGHHFYGVTPHNSRRYDTGDKLDYLKTVIDFSLERDDLGEGMKAYIIAKAKELENR
ncbi:MAG: sugar phosphate nucleotidyltransferase [Candidatus Saccharimonas sp.]